MNRGTLLDRSASSLGTRTCLGALTIENHTEAFCIHRNGSWLGSSLPTLRARFHEAVFPLRLAVVEAHGQQLAVEATSIRYDPQGPYAERLRDVPLLAPRRKAYQTKEFGVVQVIPTGTRCEIGGFAGDACPVTNLLGAAADFVVTHPNAVNASDLNEMAGNVLYVEGKSLDDFMLGHLGLMPVRSNCIGTFVDPTGMAYLDDVVHTLNAARAVGGITCDIYTVLRDEPGVRIRWSEHGCASGTVLRPETILEAVAFLIEQGVQAIGGVSVIHGVSG